MVTKVYIRADGGPQIGLGHLVRCIALAEMLQEHFAITFICKEIPDRIVNGLELMGVNMLKIQAESAFFSMLTGDEIVVLDNYYFDSAYQKNIRTKTGKLVVIDDLMDKEFYADLIINISPSVTPNNYKAQNYTRYALGLEYSLLRSSFLNYAKHKSPPVKDSILISFGGSDPNNKTLTTLKTFDNYKGTINVVVGTSYRFFDDLRVYIYDKFITNNVNLYQNLDDKELCQVMRDSKIAVCSASTVSIEYLSVTYGSLFLVLTANNQKEWYNYALKSNLANKYTDDLLLKGKKYKSNYTLQDKLIDGKQKERYLKLFDGL